MRQLERLGIGGIVDLERTGPGGYLGRCHSGKVRTRGYGGAVLAHALAAAADTVEPGRGPHSLHGYFLAAVDPATPIAFGAVPLRQGRSYSVVRVDAAQGARPVFTMTASFKRPEPGAHRRHAALPAGIAGPEDAPDGFASHDPDSPMTRVLEYRDAGPLPSALPGEIARAGWFRCRDDLGPGAVAQACGLAYLSDVSLSPTAFGRLGGYARPEGAVLASLDHAMWFHGDGRDLRAHEWLLFVQRSRIEADGRTFGRGELWTRDGVLAASVAQEALIRIPDAGRPVPAAAAENQRS